MAVMGSMAIGLVWFRGDDVWAGLLSGLVGMAAGGGLVWLVRIIGTAALRPRGDGLRRRDADGHDRRLPRLAAVRAHLLPGPPCRLVVGVLRLILFRDREIPYGPFLCLAALFVIVKWHAVWDFTWAVFEPGWLVPLIVLCCPPLMGVMLGTWRLIRNVFR